MNIEHTTIAFLFLLVGIAGAHTFHEENNLLQLLYVVVSVIAGAALIYSVCVNIYLLGQS